MESSIVEEVASSLVREFLHRKGLKKTSVILEEELPRTPQSISNRNDLRTILHLDTLYKENKLKENPLKTLLEIMTKYFLEQSEKAKTLNLSINQNSASSKMIVKQLHMKPPDSSLVNVCDISDDEIGGSSAVSDTSKTEVSRNWKSEASPKTSGSSSEGERQSVKQNHRERSKAPETSAEVNNSVAETQRPKSSRIVRGMMSGPIASSQEDSSKKRAMRRSSGINSANQSKDEALINNLLGRSGEPTNNSSDNLALQRGREFSTKVLSGSVTASVIEKASPNAMIPLSKEEGETTGVKKIVDNRLSITENEKNFKFKFPSGPWQERRAVSSKKNGKDPSLNRKMLISISNEDIPDKEDIKLDDVEDCLITDEICNIPPVIPKSTIKLEGKPIDLAQAVEVKKLLFGSSLCCFCDEWKMQSFTFNNRHPLKYGFVQKKGGPCGVLAAVQGCVLQNLLFGKDADFRVLQPSDSQRTNSLCKAIADILWRAGDGKEAVIALSSGRQQFSPAGKYKADGILETLILYNVGRYEDLMSFLQQNINQFEFGPFGCILLTLSVIFSRSVELVQKDFDVPTNCLIGAHSYCTQELVNLILCGRAVSNVFNDVMELDSGNGNITLLKGIAHRSEIGFLSLFEHYSVCQVGSYLKTPKYPIWVICSESHFSVLFCLRKELMSDWRIERRFDLYYYDGLANQQEEIRLTIDTAGTYVEDKDNDLTPPLENCIRTKWKGAVIDWNGTEPIL
ncbi:putative ubiquitin carboxyl-terminal hydrolase MINDY-4 [Rhinophrynus dorsalis]